ncbi:MAG: DUF5108 domain-containing protein [Porphyromonadaceae bacterium]|nr:DUF5108 domain-containing protein [Porphyromonadaceae bacterium]
MKNRILGMGLLLALIIACDDPYEDRKYIQDSGLAEDMTCAEYLSADEDFSLWVELLKYADYYNALNDADATATVFCPTNEAMAEFLDWRGVSSVRELDKEYARAVVQTHILNYDLTDESLIDYAENGEYIPIQTLFQTYLTTSFGYTITDVDDAELDNTVINSDSIYLANQARLDKFTAVPTSNGEIFTMGDVIHPLAETMLDKLRTYDDYTIFCGAADLCGYDEIVSRTADTVLNVGGTQSITTLKFTCLAVPDEVYEAAGISDVAGLCSYLGADEDYTDEGNALYRYIAYHFFDSEKSVADFFNFNEEGQINIYDTKCTYQVVTCQDINGEHIFNEVGRILRSDMEARNGVIHKVDNILPVWEPDPVTVIWDFCNTSEIISFVNAYGADKNLGNLFSAALLSKEYDIDLSEDKRDGDYGTISALVEDETYYATSSKASYSNYRKIGFVKCKYASSKEKDVNAYGAYMDNLMVLNIGYGGWVEFESPTIIKGKYKIELYYGANPVLYKSFASAGTSTRFTLDNESITTAYLLKGLASKGFTAATYGVVSETIFDNIEFENSGTHTLKITMMDINAKTNSTYHQLLDYVKFTPID